MATPEPSTLAIIAPQGDLILCMRQDEKCGGFSYRVDSEILRRRSRYFENLLSDRFDEGQQLSAALEALKTTRHSTIADAPADALPKISIVNVGKISRVSSIQNLAADFLRALHGLDLAVSKPPLANLANLAVVADRFAALPYFSEFIQKRKYLNMLDGKTKAKSDIPEERVRQRLLLGILFDHPQWVIRFSKHLIMRDSAQWKPGAQFDENAALWWDLPNGIEDELIKRREYVLDTINSLQSHFLKLYTSSERQCKLGYDSSVQCDSFQLGEMVRFFSRLGTLRLQGTIYDSTEPTYYTGDIDRLLESLRQCPSYQVDRNHSHCGLRVRLLPLLDGVKDLLSVDGGSLDVGICLECWTHRRSSYAWSLAKRPVSWGHSKLPGRWQGVGRGNGETGSCLGRHSVIRDIFMAVDRNWAATDAY
ncbi:hypothetical protein EJ04DRAFT_507812 [Polyplosphaeria fusca]|uniref:BTB domain-containing protein n=1 Tax=Polyplosphaeria fusca TaxID=682080 RepID=A0A9P4V9Q6_9PLEO|nr:hypothetical protein EJ04DRAFT_507812 [Polyplosphaeria fusca]